MKHKDIFAEERNYYHITKCKSHTKGSGFVCITMVKKEIHEPKRESGHQGVKTPKTGRIYA